MIKILIAVTMILGAVVLYAANFICKYIFINSMTAMGTVYDVSNFKEEALLYPSILFFIIGFGILIYDLWVVKRKNK